MSTANLIVQFLKPLFLLIGCVLLCTRVPVKKQKTTRITSKAVGAAPAAKDSPKSGRQTTQFDVSFDFFLNFK